MRAYGVNDRYLYGVGGGDGGAGVSMQLQQLAGQHGQLVVTTTSRLHLVAVQHHRLHLVQLALQHRLTDLQTQSRLAASQEGCMDATYRRSHGSPLHRRAVWTQSNVDNRTVTRIPRTVYRYF